MPRAITDSQLHHALTLRDLTDPAGGEHCMQRLVETVTHDVSVAWGAEAVVERGSAIVTVADNYDALGYPPGGAAREERYTRYVSEQTVLRTQMSATIPPTLRSLAPAPPRDLLVACPGLVYRRDVIDRLHVGEPHQLDLWRICEHRVGEEELEAMIGLACGALVPGLRWRTLPAEHPYTLDGRQIEVETAAGWVELGECGLAHPRLLKASGLREHSGLAMGLGLDRAVMLRKGVTDIRLLRSEDPRVESQMADLSPYTEVSSQPPARRDMSLATTAGIDDVELAEKVRDTLGVAAQWVEEVAVVSRTPAAELPQVARERIGITDSQENLLVRVALRHPTRSLPKQEANTLRDRIYAAIHEGGDSVLAKTG